MLEEVRPDQVFMKFQESRNRKVLPGKAVPVTKVTKEVTSDDTDARKKEVTKEYIASHKKEVTKVYTDPRKKEVTIAYTAPRKKEVTIEYTAPRKKEVTIENTAPRKKEVLIEHTVVRETKVLKVRIVNDMLQVREVQPRVDGIPRLAVPSATNRFLSISLTVCPRSNDPFYIV